MDLSVIIVNWNTRELLEQCLLSIEDVGTLRRHPSTRLRTNSDPAMERWNVEAFVVDNGSRDGSVPTIRERFPWVCLIENDENVGFARANNQAIRRSEGRYVVLLNSDTEVRPSALETMTAFMDAHPRAGACGPRLLNSDGGLQPSCHPMLTPWREFWRLTFLNRVKPLATYDMAAWDQERPRQVEVIKGACLMVRRKALDEVGLLDERYFMYTEEVDLCHRLREAGWQLWWVPQAVVKHHGEASSKQMAETMYVQLYRSKVRFYRKFGGQRRAARFQCLVRAAYRPRLAVATLGAPFSSTLAARASTYRRLLTELPGM